MESDLVLEIVLYFALLGLMFVIRWWQNSKHLYQPTAVARPVVKLPLVRVKRKRRPVERRESSVEELSWRKVQPTEKPKETPENRKREIIDLRPAFEHEPVSFSYEVEHPPCPPNSPSFEPFLTVKDEDFERRRNYVKKQVTDGEVMMRIETYEVCQIFVHGIEYHYVFDGKDTSWDLPNELESISEWFLKIPKSRRRKAPETPPLPVEHIPDSQPVFI